MTRMMMFSLKQPTDCTLPPFLRFLFSSQVIGVRDLLHSRSSLMATSCAALVPRLLTLVLHLVPRDCLSSPSLVLLLLWRRHDIFFRASVRPFNFKVMILSDRMSVFACV